MSRRVVLRWTPELDDLLDAFEARRYALGFRRRELMLAWLCLVVAVVFFLFTLLAPGVVLVLIGLVLAWPGTGRIMARRTLRRLWAANPSLAEPAEATVSDDGVRRRAADDETGWDWSAFPVWIETPELFVLSQSEKRYGSFVSLPKRGTDDPADVRTARELMLAGMGPGRRWPRDDDLD
ncbi:MAG TPA: YcxB family protein [Nocardioides sp.]|nr:YcxB family protein [Nocardioides sp.]